MLPNASHPFWARPFPDVAIVHNGQITDYYTWRERLERKIDERLGEGAGKEVLDTLESIFGRKRKAPPEP